MLPTVSQNGLTKTINLLEPHRKQYEFLKSNAKYRAFVGGIGSGKSLIGCAETVTWALANPGCLQTVTAPTYKVLSDATIRTFFSICPPELIKKYNKGENVAEFINGSELLFRSTIEPETLRGPNISRFFMDEAALSPHMAWKILIGRLRQDGFPTRGDIATTPKGQSHWIYEEFVQKKRDKYDIFFSSSRDNPFLPSDFIEDLTDSYSGPFARQEIEGQFVAPQGTVYSNFNRSVHVGDFSSVKFKDFIYGIDWGYTNPSVILTIGIDADNRAYIVEEFYERRVMIETHLEEAKKTEASHARGPFVADPSEPQFIQKFRNDGLNAQEANNEILPGINRIYSRLELKGDKKPALFVDQRCVNTIMEFENYRYPDSKEGKPVSDKPLKVHDHAMDALRYAISYLDQGSNEFTYLASLAGLLNR